MLLAVADKTWDRAGHWVVDWPELEVMCSLSRRSIRRYLAQLQANGLLTLAPRYDQRSGIQLTNHCLLHLGRTITARSEWVEADVPEVDEKGGEGTKSGHLPNSGEGTKSGQGGYQSCQGEVARAGHPLNSFSSLTPNPVSEPSLHVVGQGPDDPSSLWITAEKILDFLNAKTGRRYQPRKPNKDPTASLKAVHALLKVGYTEQQLRQVIGNRLVKWGDDPKMREFLRPETLFRPSKFEQYLGEVGAA